MGAGRKQAVRRQAGAAQVGSSQRARLATRRAPIPGVRAVARQARWERLVIRPSSRASWRTILIFDLMVVLVMAVMAHGLFQMAFVMIANRPAQARVMALTCEAAYRSVTSDITLRYSDASGVERTVTHSNDTGVCFDQYRVGQIIPIHVSTIWPGALVTQEELDEAPGALLFRALLAACFLSLVTYFLRHPETLTALLKRMPFRKHRERTRYGQKIY